MKGENVECFENINKNSVFKKFIKNIWPKIINPVMTRTKTLICKFLTFTTTVERKKMIGYLICIALINLKSKDRERYDVC